MRGLRSSRLATVVIAMVGVLIVVGALSRGDSSRGSDLANPTTPTTATAPSATRQLPSTTSDEVPGTPATTTPKPASATTTTESPSLPRAAAAVDRLVVTTPDAVVAPYRRKMFGDGWDYDPASKCNTRERVLIEESLVPAAVDAKCRPTGQWRSAYDGVVTTDIAALEIDHLVPLADAWRSGAAGWTPQQRETYANDLTDPNTLLAVTSHTNRSKSDSTPDQWLPPDRSDWCGCATAWVEVKTRWHFTVTAPEKVALVRVLEGCGP